VRSFPELSPECQIEITGDSALALMTVKAEAVQVDLPASEASVLRERVAAQIKTAIRVTAEVEIVPPGTLPRPDGKKKMKRVVDRRNPAG
jgi:phenylacetate-CoA ligase